MKAQQRVVTLVHGTFAVNAEWTREDGLFFSALRKHLGPGLVHQNITWKGLLGTRLNNGHNYRIRGGAALADVLRTGFRLYPSAEHWVVAHSHGGNVAFYALRDAVVANRLAGVVTMATPFIWCEPRKFTKNPILFLGLVLLAFAVVGASLALAYSAIHRWAYAVAALIAVGGIGAFVLYTKHEHVYKWLARRSLEISRKLSLPEPEKQRVFCVSVARDEAGLVLRTVQVVAELPHLFWDGLVYLLLLVVLFLVALVFGQSAFDQMAGQVGLGRARGAWEVAFGWILVIFPVHFFVMLLLPRLTRALGIGFGQESILDNLVVDIRTKAAPGCANTEREYHDLPGGWLAHSRPYAADAVIGDIAEFIRSGARPICRVGSESLGLADRNR